MITKESIKERVLSMIPKVAEGMTHNLDIMLSECENVINLEAEEDNYIVPKMFIRALLKEEMFQYETYIEKKRQDKIVEQLYTLI